jgi:hypothetical protein
MISPTEIGVRGNSHMMMKSRHVPTPFFARRRPGMAAIRNASPVGGFHQTAG